MPRGTAGDGDDPEPGAAGLPPGPVDPAGRRRLLHRDVDVRVVSRACACTTPPTWCTGGRSAACSPSGGCSTSPAPTTRAASGHPICPMWTARGPPALHRRGQLRQRLLGSAELPDHRVRPRRAVVRPGGAARPRLRLVAVPRRRRHHLDALDDRRLAARPQPVRRHPDPALRPGVPAPGRPGAHDLRGHARSASPRARTSTGATAGTTCVTAEGGTSWEHQITVARSRSLFGPYEADPAGPMLTSSGHPELALQKAGHGSLVSTPDGRWYLAHLAARPYSPLGPCVLGRETAIQAVDWPEGGWPRVDGGVPADTVLPPSPVDSAQATDARGRPRRLRRPGARPGLVDAAPARDPRLGGPHRAPVAPAAPRWTVAGRPAAAEPGGPPGHRAASARSRPSWSSRRPPTGSSPASRRTTTRGTGTTPTSPPTTTGAPCWRCSPATPAGSRQYPECRVDVTGVAGCGLRVDVRRARPAVRLRAAGRASGRSCRRSSTPRSSPTSTPRGSSTASPRRGASPARSSGLWVQDLGADSSTYNYQLGSLPRVCKPLSTDSYWLTS